MKKESKLGAKSKIGYMMGDFGCNMSFQLIGTYLLIFISDALRINAFLMGIIVLVAKIFDAINDPIIGSLIDKRKSHKHGKYKPWIFVGAFAIALTTTLLFVDVASWPVPLKFTYVLLMYMLWSVAYTIANVPYGSLNAALTDDAKERTTLSSLRSIGAGLAMLPIMIFVPGLIYEADKTTIKPGAFVYIALVCGIIGIIGFMLTIFLTKEKVVEVPEEQQHHKVNYLETLKNCFHNKAIVALCIASFAQLVFILTNAIMIPYVCKYYFADGSLQSIANVLLMLPMVIFIPFMGKLTAKFGNKKIVALPNIIGIAALTVMLFIPYKSIEGGFWIYLVLYMIAMFGGGTFTLATWSMVAECVDEQEVISGVREEASVYATYSFVRKFAQGIGAALVSVILGLIGYKAFENPDDMFIHNSAPAVANGILYLSIILPLIGFIVVFFVMQFMYKLDKNKVLNNTMLLRQKHHIVDENNNEISNDEVSDVLTNKKE